MFHAASSDSPHAPACRLVDDGCQLDGYNQARPFASFFPGLAGELGIPLWLFYVNRGQCVCSFGTRDKNHPILEYLPANRAWQLAASQGFRTFVKLLEPDGARFHEPFQPAAPGGRPPRLQRLTLRAASLHLEEVDEELGLAFRVDYHPLTDQPCAGLLRRLTIQELAGRPRRMELLDGLPLLVPAGVDNFHLTQMRRTVEAFVHVEELEEGLSFFRSKLEPADRPDVRGIPDGHFHLGCVEGGAGRVPVIVDPVRVFGQRTDLLHPDGFLGTPARRLEPGQQREGRLPCAFGLLEEELPAHGRLVYRSLTGHAFHADALRALAPCLQNPAWAAGQERAAAELVERLSQGSLLVSGEPGMDGYARQTCLDNGLRGGFPVTLRGRRGQATLHLFSRKHGDLERDYNDFQLARTPFSQGNGNYRDVNQNRRGDVWTSPELGLETLRQFLSLLQLDGYNPLVVKGIRYRCTDPGVTAEVLRWHLGSEGAARVLPWLEDPFTPGELALRLGEAGCLPEAGLACLLGDLLAVCASTLESSHGEGYWTDHWSYCLDLLESCLAVHPEQARELLFDQVIHASHDSAHAVLPRQRRLLVWDGRPMQLDAVVEDPAKRAALERRPLDRDRVRRGHGAGEVLRQSLLAKLLTVVANKLASLDPQGRGIEMEAGKPNWYDALNGLPGQLGSSLNETLGLKRHLLFLREAIRRHGRPGESLALFAELATFVRELGALLAEDPAPFEYWDRANAAKERYRAATWRGVSDEDVDWTLEEAQAWIQAALERLERGIAASWDAGSGLLAGYFSQQVLETAPPPPAQEDGLPAGNPRGLAAWWPRRLEAHALPVFLETQVHQLRCASGAAEVDELLARLEQGPLFDAKLGMFRLNAPLDGEDLGIGRARAFVPGWFENGSIWLHMHYKLLLELLRLERPADFHRLAARGLVPFLDPAVYGRSVLESCSFIVSSAHPDPSLHGAGQVARLSGATAEFLHILNVMCLGNNPFRLDEQGSPRFDPRPMLRGGQFLEEACTRRVWQDGAWRELGFPADSLSLVLFGDVVLTYLNPARRDTFGADSVRPAAWRVEERDGSMGPWISQPPAAEEALRLRRGEPARWWIRLEPLPSSQS